MDQTDDQTARQVCQAPLKPQLLLSNKQSIGEGTPTLSLIPQLLVLGTYESTDYVSNNVGSLSIIIFGAYAHTHTHTIPQV